MTAWIRALLTCLQHAASRLREFFVWVEWRWLPHPDDGPFCVSQKQMGNMVMRIVAHSKVCSCRYFLVELEVIDDTTMERFTVALFEAKQLNNAWSLIDYAAHALDKMVSDEEPQYSCVEVGL
jgi:hypothetical protein